MELYLKVRLDVPEGMSRRQPSFIRSNNSAESDSRCGRYRSCPWRRWARWYRHRAGVQHRAHAPQLANGWASVPPRRCRDLVGQRRQAEIDALSRITLALPVQRLMLCKLLEEDHCQEVRTGKAARRHMERSRWLGDLLALPAGELLPHGLDHLPLARDHFQRLGDVLTELGQLRRSAARAILRGGNNHTFAWQMLRKRFL